MKLTATGNTASVGGKGRPVTILIAVRFIDCPAQAEIGVCTFGALGGLTDVILNVPTH